MKKRINKNILDTYNKKVRIIMKRVYTIQSIKTKRYITDLFSDSHANTFRSENFDPKKCYYYENREIAQVQANYCPGCCCVIEINL